MAFGGRSAGSSGEGVELARGYISLTAKYSPAMNQIANDFRALEAEAKKSGVVAGANLKAGLTGGPVSFGQHLRNEFAKTGRTMESDAQAYGALIGGTLGRAIGAPFRLADRAVGSLKDNLKETAGHVTKLIGGATLLGIAFETASKGFELNKDIQDTQVQLQSFGGTAQDVAGFMAAVNDSLKGTSNNFSDVSEAAKGLFFEGSRGNVLTEQLKGLQNIAAATGASIEQTQDLYEKGVAGGTLSAIVLRGLQQQGPARQAAMRAYSMVPGKGADEEAFNKMLKAGQIDFEKFWQEYSREADGAAERMRYTFGGQIKLLQTNLAQVGGDALKGLFGGGDGKDWGINDQLTKLDNWVKSSEGQAKIKTFFNDLKTAAKDVGNAIKDVKGFIDKIPGGIKTIIEVWAGWKVISMVGEIGKVTEAIGLLGTAVSAVDFGPWMLALGPIAALIFSMKKAIDGIHAQDQAARDADKGITGPSPNDVPYKGGPFPTSQPHGIPQHAAPSPWNFMQPQPHADGYLPKHATIQNPVGPAGLVQWAEPSTHGEAYIPLNPSNRQRSLAIWKETGRRLRAFKGGGFDDHGDDYIHSVTPGSPQWNSMSLQQQNMATWISQTLGLGGYAKGGIRAFKGGGFDDHGDDYIHSVAPGSPQWNSMTLQQQNMATWISQTLGLGGYASGGIRSFDKGGINDGPVAEIVKQGRAAGYSDDQIAWIVADAIGESGLNPNVTNKSGHHGLFQQDSGYPARGTMQGQVAGFYGRLGPADRGGDIGSRITGVEKGGYGSDWIKQYLGQAEGLVAGVGGKDKAVPVDISKVDGKSLKDGGGSGGGGGGGDDPISSLMGIAKSGLSETFSVPGFTNYANNPWFKSAGAAMKMIMPDGLGGLLPKGLGDSLMHPLRGALAASNPARAAELGWTGTPVDPGGGRGSLARGATGRPDGNLAAGLRDGSGGRGGTTVNINGGALVSNGVADQISQDQADKALYGLRRGPSTQADTSRIGQ
jgi:Tape measure protein